MRNKTFLYLHLIIAIYSLSSFFSKLAGTYTFLSIGFCLCYVAVIGILGIYAIGWQQIIKRIPLTTAFANKSFTVVWGLLLGIVFFDETVTIGKILGIILIILGIVLFVHEDGEGKNVR